MKRKTLAIVVGITGIFWLLVGLGGFVTSPHGLHARSSSADGKVIEVTGVSWTSTIRYEGDPRHTEGHTDAKVIVEFFVDGKRYTAAGAVRETPERPASKIVGISVPVSYEPRDPTNSTIGHEPDKPAFFSQWIILLSIGAVLILVSVCILLRSRFSSLPSTTVVENSNESPKIPPNSGKTGAPPAQWTGNQKLYAIFGLLPVLVFLASLLRLCLLEEIAFWILAPSFFACVLLVLAVNRLKEGFAHAVAVSIMYLGVVVYIAYYEVPKLFKEAGPDPQFIKNSQKQIERQSPQGHWSSRLKAGDFVSECHLSLNKDSTATFSKTSRTNTNLGSIDNSPPRYENGTYKLVPSVGSSDATAEITFRQEVWKAWVTDNGYRLVLSFPGGSETLQRK